MDTSSSLIHRLREVLLFNASKKVDQELFGSLIESIIEITNCHMCSLWSVNNNSTPGKRGKIFQSISIIETKLKEGLVYEFKKDEDYVLELKDTFISKTIENKKTYFLGNKNDHKNKDCLEKLDLNYFIGIPIPDFKNQSTTIAVLKLSFKNNPHFHNYELNSFAAIIRDYFSSLLYRHMLLKKQKIIDELIKNEEEYGLDGELSKYFYPIIKTILCKYCDYEGASLFIWDSYMNRYTLLETITDIEIKNDENNCYQTINKNEKSEYPKVYYQFGEGLTGQAARDKNSIIYDDLNYEKKTNSNYQQKTREKTEPHQEGKTMMLVPIIRPSNSKDVIGILRLINKKNEKKKEVIDYFNDVDLELIHYASKYIALTFVYFLELQERNNFLSKLSHEFSTPANAIRITADRLIRMNDDKDSMDRNYESYMDSIQRYAELQLQQARNNLFLSNVRINIPKVERYKTSRTSLKDIIINSKKTVIPIAREEGVRFDNIFIANNFPLWQLFIDISAFEMIFYNLFTNAIKYRDRDPKKQFVVSITGYDLKDKLIIIISDWGLGIDEKDKDNIFLMGFQAKNFAKHITSGFGIGLAVIKQIITDYEGEINLTSLKLPTTFEIKLPRYLLKEDYTKTDVWKH